MRDLPFDAGHSLAGCTFCQGVRVGLRSRLRCWEFRRVSRTFPVDMAFVLQRIRSPICFVQGYREGFEAASLFVRRHWLFVGRKFIAVCLANFQEWVKYE